MISQKNGFTNRMTSNKTPQKQPKQIYNFRLWSSLAIAICRHAESLTSAMKTLSFVTSFMSCRGFKRKPFRQQPAAFLSNLTTDFIEHSQQPRALILV